MLGGYLICVIRKGRTLHGPAESQLAGAAADLLQGRLNCSATGLVVSRVCQAKGIEDPASRAVTYRSRMPHVLIPASLQPSSGHSSDELLLLEAAVFGFS